MAEEVSNPAPPNSKVKFLALLLHHPVPRGSEPPNCAGPPGFCALVPRFHRVRPPFPVAPPLSSTLLLSEEHLQLVYKAVPSLGPGFLFQAEPTQGCVSRLPQSYSSLPGAAWAKDSASTIPCTCSTLPVFLKAFPNSVNQFPGTPQQS